MKWLKLNKNNWLKTNKCIRIKCDTESECTQMQKFLFNNGYTWINKDCVILTFDSDEYPKNLYCNYLKERYTFCHAIIYRADKEEDVQIYKKAKSILRKTKLNKINENR